MSENSFFINNKINNIENIINSNMYVEYQQPLYEGSNNFMQKHRRRKFLYEIEKWFNEPLYYHKSYNDLYKYTINNESIDNSEDINNELITYDKSFDKMNLTNVLTIDENELTIRDQCKAIYEQLYDVITSNGYFINDINQFKEDIIYFIYRLSNK